MHKERSDRSGQGIRGLPVRDWKWLQEESDLRAQEAVCIIISSRSIAIPGQPHIFISDPELPRNKSQHILLQCLSICQLFCCYETWGKEPGGGAEGRHPYEGHIMWVWSPEGPRTGAGEAVLEPHPDARASATPVITHPVPRMSTHSRICSSYFSCCLFEALLQYP